MGSWRPRKRHERRSGTQRLRIEKGNAAQVNYLKNKCIYHLFEEQAKTNFDQIAVTFIHQQITYKELNCRVNKLANYLQTQGVRNEALVGICLERSHYTVIGLLAILKAGGAYVPLDPSYPQDRLAYMVEDTKLSVILTQQKLMGICHKFILENNIKRKWVQ